MMADPIDDAIQAAQKAAFSAASSSSSGKVVPMRAVWLQFRLGQSASRWILSLDGDAPVWVVGGIIQSNTSMR